MLKRLAPFLVFIVIAIALAIGLTRDPGALPSQMIGKPFPAFDQAQLDEEAPRLGREDIIGEVMLVNVFGSWCAACTIEHPMLMEIAASERVKLIGLNWDDTRENAGDWLEEHGNPYDLILFDEHSELAMELGNTRAPETYLVDAEGVVQFVSGQPITQDIWQETLLPLIVALEDGA